MGLTFTQKSIRLLLVLMIALSLVLSRLIWVQSNQESANEASLNNAPTAQKISLKEVFVPVRAVRHTANEGLQAMTSEMVLQKLVEETAQLSFDSLSEKEIPDVETYLKLLTNKGTVELIFSDQLELNYFSEVFDFDWPSKIAKDINFNRLLLDMKKATISFLDDSDLTVYQTNYSGNTEDLRALLNDSNIQYLEMEQSDYRTGFIHYDYVNDIHLKKYSYILETQAYSVFTSRLLEANQEIKTPNDYSKDLEFTTKQGQRLNISNKNGMITFEEPINAKMPTNIYRLGSEYLKKIGKTVGSVHYFNHTPEFISYRQFVEGYPIFSEDHRSSVLLGKVAGNVQLWLNQNTIQVPIPLDEEIVLPKTAKILEQMQQAKVDETKLSGVQIGYTWVKDSLGNKPIVTLVPEWYVRYEDRWQRLATVLAEAKTSEGSGN